MTHKTPYTVCIAIILGLLYYSCLITAVPPSTPHHYLFLFVSKHFIQSREVAFDSALAHRQSLRHLSSSYCRRLFYKTAYFLLTLIEFRLRHITVKRSSLISIRTTPHTNIWSLWTKWLTIASRTARSAYSGLFFHPSGILCAPFPYFTSTFFPLRMRMPFCVPSTGRPCRS